VRSTTSGNINTATRPAYQAAEAHALAPADFDPIAHDPAFQASLRRLRDDEVLGPIYHGQPDNSVAVIEAVTKDKGRSPAFPTRFPLHKFNNRIALARLPFRQEDKEAADTCVCRKLDSAILMVKAAKDRS
jgi:hypothetical protein